MHPTWVLIPWKKTQLFGPFQGSIFKAFQDGGWGVGHGGDNFQRVFFCSKTDEFLFFWEEYSTKHSANIGFSTENFIYIYIYTFFSKPLIQWIVVLRPEVTSRNEFFFPGGLTIP